MKYKHNKIYNYNKDSKTLNNCVKLVVGDSQEVFFSAQNEMCQFMDELKPRLLSEKSSSEQLTTVLKAAGIFFFKRERMHESKTSNAKKYTYLLSKRFGKHSNKIYLSFTDLLSALVICPTLSHTSILLVLYLLFLKSGHASFNRG